MIFTTARLILYSITIALTVLFRTQLKERMATKDNMARLMVAGAVLTVPNAIVTFNLVLEFGIPREYLGIIYSLAACYWLWQVYMIFHE